MNTPDLNGFDELNKLVKQLKVKAEEVSKEHKAKLHWFENDRIIMAERYCRQISEMYERLLRDSKGRDEAYKKSTAWLESELLSKNTENQRLRSDFEEAVTIAQANRNEIKRLREALESIQKLSRRSDHDEMVFGDKEVYKIAAGALKVNSDKK